MATKKISAIAATGSGGAAQGAAQGVSGGVNPAALASAVAAGAITAEQARNMLGGQTQNTAAATSGGLTPAQAQLKAEAETRAAAQRTAVPDYDAVLKQVEAQTAAAREAQAQKDAQAAATAGGLTPAQAQLKAEAETRAKAAAASPNYNAAAPASAVAAGAITAEQARNMLGGQQTAQTTAPNYNDVLKSLAEQNPQVSANTVANLTVPTAEQVRATTEQAQTSGGLTPAQAQIKAEAEKRQQQAAANPDSGADTRDGSGAVEADGGYNAPEDGYGEADSSWEDVLEAYLEERQGGEEDREDDTDGRETDREDENDREADARSEYLTSYPVEAGRAPERTNEYETDFRRILEELEAYPAFQYDQNSDPVWTSLAKQYRREGQRATADTLGQLAANTGGVASSYAATAAAQAGNYYAGQLADRLPEVYQQAYQRYLDEYSRKLGLANEYLSGMGAEEQRYQADLAQWNADRNFNYQQYLDQVAQESADREFSYQQYLDRQKLQTAGSGGSGGGSRTYGQTETVLPQQPAADNTADGLKAVFPNGYVTDGKTWSALVGLYGEDWLAQNGFRRVTAPAAKTETKDVPVVTGGTGNYSGLEGKPKKDISATYFDNGEQSYDSIEAEYQAALKNTSRAVAFIKKYGGYTPLSESEFSRSTGMSTQYGTYVRYIQSLLAALMA